VCSVGRKTEGIGVADLSDRSFDLKVAACFLDQLGFVSYNGRRSIVTGIQSVVIVVSLMLLVSRANASPIGSIDWTSHTPSLETTPIGIAPASGAVQSLASLSSVVAPLDLSRARLSFGYLTTILSVDRLSPRLAVDPSALLVKSVAGPPPLAFEEPSAWVMVLIGLGIFALGGARLRRRALAGDDMQRRMTA